MCGHGDWLGSGLQSGWVLSDLSNPSIGHCSTNSKSNHVISNSKLHYRACATICTLQNLNYRPWCGALLWEEQIFKLRFCDFRIYDFAIFELLTPCQFGMPYQPCEAKNIAEPFPFDVLNNCRHRTDG